MNSLNYTNLASVTFPDTLEVIEDDPFSNIPIRKLFIPASVRTISSANFFNVLPLLERIDVDPNSKTFASIDGVMYSKDLTMIIQYPRNNNQTTFIVPKSVKILGNDAFSRNTVIKTIVLLTNLHKIEARSFYATDNITIMIPYQCKISIIINSTLEPPGFYLSSIISYYLKLESKKCVYYLFTLNCCYSHIFMYS